jgi:hypothetical protein
MTHFATNLDCSSLPASSPNSCEWHLQSYLRRLLKKRRQPVRGECVVVRGCVDQCHLFLSRLVRQQPDADWAAGHDGGSVCVAENLMDCDAVAVAVAEVVAAVGYYSSDL